MQKGHFEFSKDFLKGLSNGAGYDSNAAISELIDNSIGAGAKEIRITFADGHFKIQDFGDDAGMDEKTLKRNFFYGGASSTKSNPKAAGKFGIGGKTGILALIGSLPSTDIEIFTHKKDRKPVYARWPYSTDYCDYFEIDVMNDDSVPYGTAIEFDYQSDISNDDLRKYVSVVYCWAIADGVKIYVNGSLIVPSDPLYRNNRNVIRNNIFSTKGFKILGEEVVVNITAFSESESIPSSELNGFDRDGRRMKTVLTANRSGIYLRTEGRYYTIGNNFDKVMGGTAHASMDGLRVEVILPKKLWSLIGITWNKGRDITPFKKVKAFIDSGLYDYIWGRMREFSNRKKVSTAEKINHIQNSINSNLSSPHADSIIVEVMASCEKQVPFVCLHNGKLTFDLSGTAMKNKKEISGTIRTLSIVVDSLIKSNNENLAKNIISKFN